MAFGLLNPSPRIFGEMTVLHRNGLFLGLPFLMGGMLIRRYGFDQRFSLPVLTLLIAVSLALIGAEGHVRLQAATGRTNHDNLRTVDLASPAILLFDLKFQHQTTARTLGTYANVFLSAMSRSA